MVMQKADIIFELLLSDLYWHQYTGGDVEEHVVVDREP